MELKAGGRGMLRILQVDNSTLDIELSNGHLVLFSMKPLLDHNPAYASLRGKVPFPCPVNQGVSLCWPDGPVLALDDILALLAQQNEET